MEPRARDEPFDSPKHIFEVKWDGVRMLAFCGQGGEVRLQNRRLHDRTLQYPELQVLGSMIGQTAVLDGEVVAFSGGRPSFFRVMQRDGCGTEQRVLSKRATIPVTYMVFDILMYRDKPLLSAPLTDRKAILESVLPATSEHIYLTESHGSSGTSLFRATREQGLEGIVGKELSSPYVPGGKSAYWTKIKHRKRQLCTLVGYALGAGGFISLLAGCWTEDGYAYIGRVSSGLNSDIAAQLTTALPGIIANQPSVNNPSSSPHAKWVKPQITFIAEFFEWTDDMKMRSPVFIGFTGEPPEASIFEQEGRG